MIKHEGGGRRRTWDAGASRKDGASEVYDTGNLSRETHIRCFPARTEWILDRGRGMPYGKDQVVGEQKKTLLLVIVVLGADTKRDCGWCCKAAVLRPRPPTPAANETISVPSTSLDAWEAWAPKDLDPTDLLLLKVGGSAPYCSTAVLCHDDCSTTTGVP